MRLGSIAALFGGRGGGGGCGRQSMLLSVKVWGRRPSDCL